jgi:DNA topoisomerase-1
MVSLLCGELGISAADTPESVGETRGATPRGVTAGPAAGSTRRVMPTLAAAPRTAVRLRRSDCSSAGLRRVGHGRAFEYRDPAGERVTDADTLARIRDLAIPPAWREVWICLDPRGHLQATGIDAAGRKQYRYHDAWRRRRDREKFRRMLEFGEALPQLRRAVARELDDRGLGRERVLACALRLLDIGLFRIGGEEYADEGGGLGLATLRRSHVTLGERGLRFDYPAKSGVRRVQVIVDPPCERVVRALKERPGRAGKLLAYQRDGRWLPVRADDINEHLKALIGERFSAKDFRTWNATVLAAAAIAAGNGGATSEAARRRAIGAAVRHVSEALGNTPAVARRAYIDPRVFDRYLSGWTIAPALPRGGHVGPRARARIERAVLDLLTEDDRSDRLAHDTASNRAA